jgi:hypothetical protein
MTGGDGFQQEAVFRVLRDPEVGSAWGQQVCGELNENRDAVSQFLVYDEILNGRQRWEWWQRLMKVDSVRYGPTDMGENV